MEQSLFCFRQQSSTDEGQTAAAQQAGEEARVGGSAERRLGRREGGEGVIEAAAVVGSHPLGEQPEGRAGGGSGNGDAWAGARVARQRSGPGGARQQGLLSQVGLDGDADRFGQPFPCLGEGAQFVDGKAADP